jgi:hypothetical protein
LHGHPERSRVGFDAVIIHDGFIHPPVPNTAGT